MSRRNSLILTLILTVQSVFAAVSVAEERFDFAATLPPQTLAYVELSEPTKLLDVALSDRLISLLSETEDFQKYLGSKDFQTLQAVIDALESKVSVDWEEGVRKLTGGGFAASFDPTHQAIVLMLRSRDADLLSKTHEALVELIEDDATNKGKESPVKNEEYEGVRGWTFGKGESHAIVGDLLLVSNKDDALKAWVDRHNARRDEKEKSESAATATLADDKMFQKARAEAGADASGFAFVRLAPLRLLAGLSRLAERKSDNPLVELIAGGIVDSLPHADYAVASLMQSADGALLSARLPLDREKISKMRQWYFSKHAAGDEGAAVVPDVEGLLASLVVERNVAGMWMARSDIFDEKTNVGFTQADTNLGLYFSGRDFGSQVLGELAPTWRVVAALQSYGDEGQPVPALKLPATAVIWELAHPDEFAPHLQMAFQNIIGITNLDGVQKGRSQLLLKTETRGPAEIQYGTYLTVGDAPKTDAHLQFNFRPACARMGRHFIVGTHVALVRNLVDALADPKAVASKKQEAAATNLKLTVQGAQLVEVLEANRPLIVGRAMLSAGGDREKAGAQLDAALTALRELSTFEVRLLDDAKSLGVEAEVKLRSAR